MAAHKDRFIKVAVTFPDHPKIEALNDGAFRLLITVWCRCAVLMSDGLVSDSWWRKQPLRARQELISSALVVQEGDKWRAHDYLVHQQSRAQIESKSAVRAQAGRAGGLAKAKRAATNLPSNLPSKNVPEEEVEEEVEEELLPAPAAPAPKRATGKAKTTIPAEFEVTLALRDWARTNGIDCNLTTETQQWHDYHVAKGDTGLDWTASWRYWMRNTKKFGPAAKAKPAAPVRDW